MFQNIVYLIIRQDFDNLNLCKECENKISYLYKNFTTAWATASGMFTFKKLTAEENAQTEVFYAIHTIFWLI